MTPAHDSRPLLMIVYRHHNDVIIAKKSYFFLKQNLKRRVLAKLNDVVELVVA